MKYVLSLVLFLGLITMACNDSIEIGSEVLNNNLDVEVDTVEIPARIILADSVLTFTNTANSDFTNSRYMLGQLDDPEYGNVEAVVYFNVTQNTVFPVGFADMEFDSVVMVFPYDTLVNYGPDGGEYEISLFELTEPFTLEEGDNLYAKDGLEHNLLPKFSSLVTVNHRDSVTLDDYRADSTGIRDIPQLRLKLDPQMWVDFFQSNDLESLTIPELEEQLKGYALKASSVTNNSLIGLGLIYNGSDQSQNRGDIKFFARNDSTRVIFELPLGKLRQNQFIHDYSGSDIEAIIASDSQEELYLQSQAGVEVELDLSALKADTDFILNSASINVTVISSTDEDVYPLPEKLFAKHIQNGRETVVVDAAIAAKFSLVQEKEVNGEMVRCYSIDITDHANSIIDESVDTDKIILFPSNKATRPNRVKICGPDHPLYPTQLKVVKTTL